MNKEGVREGQVFTFAVLIQATQSGARSIAQRNEDSSALSLGFRERSDNNTTDDAD
jgi:hypothetical protein